MKDLISPDHCAVWINSDVLSAAEITLLRSSGVNLTTVSSRIDPKFDNEIVGLLPIVAMHHPGDRLWVEFQSE